MCFFSGIHECVTVCVKGQGQFPWLWSVLLRCWLGERNLAIQAEKIILQLSLKKKTAFFQNIQKKTISSIGSPTAPENGCRKDLMNLFVEICKSALRVQCPLP